MKGKMQIGFDLQGSKKQHMVGKVERFKWDDAYNALRVINKLALTAESQIVLEAMLQGGKEVVHDNLWTVLTLVYGNHFEPNPVMQVCAWVLACYGYSNGLSTYAFDGTWPNPGSPPPVCKDNWYNYREELACPLCKRKWIVPKKYKNKDAVVRAFGRWMLTHVREPH